MGRPPKYPADAKPRLQVNGGPHYQPDRMKVGVIDERTATALRRQSERLVKPTIAGYYDPISITLLVDCLLRLEHDTTVRARDLAEILNTEYPQLIWNAQVAGRILGDLAEAAATLDTDVPPVERISSKGGSRYLVNVTEGNWHWLAQVRIRVGALAERAVAIARATGETTTAGSFPFDAVAQIEYIRDRKAA